MRPDETIEAYNRLEFETLYPKLAKFEKLCFPKELQMDYQEMKDCLDADSGAIGVVARKNGEFAGMSYGNLFKTMDETFFDGYWYPQRYRKYRQNQTIYVTSTMVAPKYRGDGLAIRMRSEFIKLLKSNHYRYMVGHANSGTMIQIAKLFEGTIRGKFPRWYGSHETHYLYECDLTLAPIFFDVPKTIQSNNYNCGVASVECLMTAKGYSGHLIRQVTADLHPTSKLGLSHEEITSALQKHGVEYLTLYHRTIEQLIELLKLDGPVMVNYQVPLDKPKDGHYSIIMGYSPHSFYIRDVADGKIHKVSHKLFYKNWVSKFYGQRWVLMLA